MDNKTFYDEAVEWMDTVNYSVHFHSADKTSITFMCNDLDYQYPSITCFLDENNDKRCSLSNGTSFKLFLQLKSGDLSFKHPNIQKYGLKTVNHIDTFVHYGELAKRFPAF